MMETNTECRILIADDEVTTRNLLASILREAGYRRIDQAGDGTRALAMVSDPAAGYQIAFLDIDMPGHTGIEVMQSAKTVQADCAWIIVTAHSGVDNVMAAFKGGASGFIVKPYNAKKIHDVLCKLDKEKA